MSVYIPKGRLQIAETLYQFIQQQVLPDTQLDPEQFWLQAESVFARFIPKNQQLLAKRDTLQQQLDDYHRQFPGQPDPEHYRHYLQEIGYLVSCNEQVKISTDGVDDEVATLAGPQLVVPINNARYALNAANARWGSLYDAAYGTDIISNDDGAEAGKGYNPVRGQKVIEYARHWLDTIAPLGKGSHLDSQNYAINTGELVVTLKSGITTTLADPQAYLGYKGNANQPEGILLVHNGLHLEIQFDANHPVGQSDPAKIKDMLLESALSTIMDCEDSVAAVDAEDKTLVYQNWLGLMQGTLSADISKPGKTQVRTLAKDRTYTHKQKGKLTLKGRSLMFVRNVGHLMTSDAMLFDQQPVPEGMMDAIVTSLIAKHDLAGNSPFKNSEHHSVYIVKPKMHGPEEVAFSDQLFAAVEILLQMPANTLKMGIMDEERRTSVNLKACIAAAQSRVVFINTGFLDRTGDEIHTSMLAGTFAGKDQLKQMPWIQAYEKANVAIGLACGLNGKAQIGKGMWAIPDNMQAMMETKIAHVQSGANTAWVPSPTAATLHALHYHQQSCLSIRQQLLEQNFDGLSDILTVPLKEKQQELSASEIQKELDNNVQGILGYVVRWVHQGIGCSKVPDINHVGLMEDRATLRISSQHIANWLEHGMVSAPQVEEALMRLAKLVDEQNTQDPGYLPMYPDPPATFGYQAARELIFAGKAQPSGYTEPLLHAKRQQMKQANKPGVRV